MRRASHRRYVLTNQVRTPRVSPGIYFFGSLLLSLSALPVFPAWQNATAGLPPVSIVSAKAMGADTDKGPILQDKLGRIFIGSRSLLVFDGQAWRSYPKPGEYSLAFLTPGPDGILWAGATNALGYFREESLGEFKFHSLLSEVPESAQPLAAIWGCAPLGRVTYFICKEKLLRWDGRAFQVSPFPTKLRLAPLRIGDEHWVQHPETGLYRLTETGPELKFTADQLPVPLIIALFRHEGSVVTVSNDGLRRAGQSAPYSVPELNGYLTQHRVSAFCELPDGSLAIGTLSGGLVLATRTGKILRICADATSGLPGRAITGLIADPSGEVLGTTPSDFFHFPGTGNNTVFNALNGLRGQSVDTFAWLDSTLYAATEDGAYRQIVTPDQPAAFQAIPHLPARYFRMLPHEDGLLLTRFGGIDWFDGHTARVACFLMANASYQIVQARAQPDAFYVGELNGLMRLTRKPDGSFERDRFLELPDNAFTLHEDANGRIWIGTVSRGAFIYDPATRQLAPVIDPTTGKPLEGPVRIMVDDTRMLFFLNGRVLQADPLGRHLRPVSGLPAVAPASVYQRAATGEVLVAYQRPAATAGSLHGVGVLSFSKQGDAAWRELDLPDLDAIGSIRTITFSEENDRPALWLGGMAGILRLDYDGIRTLQPPTAPIIRVADDGNKPTAGGIPEYPFKDHHVRFGVFTGSYIQSENWLFQTRLGDGTTDWSPPSPRRSFDYTNLSEGTYRFEVRAVNAAGVPGPSVAFTFYVLPPWYRSGPAFASYAATLLLAVFGFIRIRERRIRARNEELESLVDVRTAELVKASAAKDEFLAGVSHEIRNPMNGVIGIAENFRTEGLDPESRRKFSLLRQCAGHLSSLLEDILDFSKVQAGAIELDPRPFDLPELVDSVAGITRADSEKYGIPVEFAVSPAVPRRLVGDARRVRQILINFVSNALKFSGRGQVSVTLWCKEAGPGRTEVIFAVSDDGPGISPGEQARLFTRFERGAAAQKGRVPGTGLGLALCKGLAEKMGGRIWLESELGHGSCFYFSAPFEVVEAPVEAAAATPAAAAGRRLALVVDDQEYNRIVLTDLLQSMDFTVHSTQEGQAALDLAARQAFDVVFLDFNLPGLSGVDVARGIRVLPGPTAHALILATTAFTTPEKRAQCLDAGMDAFLSKPVTRERLVKALSNLAPATSSAPPVPPASKKPDAPADSLGNLRLLARRKGVPLADELALYFADLEAELAQLDAAIGAGDAIEAGRFAHLLCGRCSFIFERELEQAQRKIEAAVGAAQWAEARRHRQEFGALLAAARVRLASSGSAAGPPA